MLYVSTDYVFDGKNAPYKETDEPNPLNKNGESKLEGEKTVLAFKGKCVFFKYLTYPLQKQPTQIWSVHT